MNEMKQKPLVQRRYVGRFSAVENDVSRSSKKVSSCLMIAASQIITSARRLPGCSRKMIVVDGTMMIIIHSDCICTTDIACVPGLVA